MKIERIERIFSLRGGFFRQGGGVFGMEMGILCGELGDFCMVRGRVGGGVWDFWVVLFSQIIHLGRKSEICSAEGEPIGSPRLS